MYIGIQPAEFDDLTPRMLNMMYKAFCKRKRDEAKNMQQQAYNIGLCVMGMLGGALSGKKLPEFSDFFREAPAKRQKMSESDIEAEIYRLNRLFGGEVKE